MLSNKLKKIDAFDMSLIKLSTIAFTLFVITLWETAMTWVHGINTWYFLIAFIIFAIRPIYRVHIK